MRDYSLEAVRSRCRCKIPEYAGAGVPLGVVAALNHAGVEIDFAEFAAASGWAFSFGYRYDDISPAFMAVRGKPGDDGPLEVFAFLPEALGFGYEKALTVEPEKLWRFAKVHIDAGNPIMSEHLDGGLITDYQEASGQRRLLLDGTAGGGWIAVNAFQPSAFYVLVKQRESRPRGEITRLALRRALGKGLVHDFRGVPQGLAALEAYARDVADPAKDFQATKEWFCWAAFERLMARRFVELWLRSVADELEGSPSVGLREAADHYGQAFLLFDEYRREMGAGVPTPRDARPRIDSANRFECAVPALRCAIAAETRALESLKGVVQKLD